MRRNLLCLAALALMLLTATGCVKNGLIAKEETINEKWAEIDNMLKSRNDKLPSWMRSNRGSSTRSSRPKSGRPCAGGSRRSSTSRPSSTKSWTRALASPAADSPARSA